MVYFFDGVEFGREEQPPQGCHFVQNFCGFTREKIFPQTGGGAFEGGFAGVFTGGILDFLVFFYPSMGLLFRGDFFSNFSKGTVRVVLAT